VRLWCTTFAVVGTTTVVALACTKRTTSFDWFLMGAALVVSVAWAVETTTYAKEH
jgi:uncharacterized SAM-binding protein YcdF (DUF218 family)